MQYAEGSMGRVFAARLEDGEPVYDAIEALARQEGVESGLVVLVGGARSATLVCGPKAPTGPLEPILRRFDDARELLGVGTIYPSEQGPKLHLHAGFGRKDSALVGCPRYGLNTYLILEAFIVEVKGLNAARMPDPESGLELLRFLDPRGIPPRQDENRGESASP